MKYSPEPLHFWLDAATLVSPAGNLVMIAGPSRSGKSTLTLAVTAGLHWSALAEDVTLVDPSTRLLQPIRKPFSLRAGAPEMIKQAVGLEAAPLVGGEWFERPASFSLEERLAAFSFAIRLQGTGSAAPFGVTDLEPADFIRGLMPLTNALRLDNGIELLESMLRDAACFVLESGTLAERIGFLAQMEATYERLRR